MEIRKMNGANIFHYFTMGSSEKTKCADAPKPLKPSTRINFKIMMTWKVIKLANKCVFSNCYGNSCVVKTLVACHVAMYCVSKT